MQRPEAFLLQRRRALAWVPLLLVAGCGTVARMEPLRVQVVDVQPAGGENLEIRLQVRLRLQNPNEFDIAYDGISVELELRNALVATGVTNASGTIPRFGETVVTLPVSASALNIAREAFNLFLRGDSHLPYVVRGKVGGALFNTVSFESRGELSLPAALLVPGR
ncbi:LEA type 2 family protein [Ramlibacter agri]|nr:LEA type 2 family protein [Ramlibacter agri]